MNLIDDPLYLTVHNQILALALPGLDASAITPASSLLDDVGLDSLKLVDLTVALEEALGVDEFPMQDWVDSQQGDSSKLTVASLVYACRELLSNQEQAAP